MAAGANDKFNKVISGTTRPVATTLASQKLSGATTASLVAATGWDTDTALHGIMYRTNADGTKTAGSQIDWKATLSGTTLSNFQVTAGTDDTYAIGTTVELAPTAAWGDDMATGLLVEHKQDGSHSDIHADSITTDTLIVNDSTTTAGYNALGIAPNSVTYNGNRSYSLVFPGVDYTDRLSPGMRLQTVRTVAAPNQCTSLNGTSQYFVKTSPNKMTFTDDFVVSAWVKLNSYAAASIASRYNGTSGWELSITAAGTVFLRGYNAGAGNLSQVLSYQALPLNKWVHVTAQLDMSTFTATTTTSYIMLDGTDIPAAVSRTGTNPTALVQAGNLEIGSYNGGTQLWPGKIAQVAVFSAKVTQATMRGYISQGLAGNETNLASAYSFSNSITDLNTTTPNDLSVGGGSATATNADSPFGGQASGLISTTLDYAVVRSASFSTDTTVVVQAADVCTIPTSGGVSATSYSINSAAYGCPAIDNILGYAQINTAFAGTTNAGNGDDVSGLISTVTPPPNRKIRFRVTGKSIKSSASAGQTVSVRIIEGTTEIFSVTQQVQVTGYNLNPCFTSPPITPSSGAHTYKVNLLQSAAGTQTLDASSTAPASLTVELVE